MLADSMGLFLVIYLPQNAQVKVVVGLPEAFAGRAGGDQAEDGGLVSAGDADESRCRSEDFHGER